jgi:hypothetical protein
MPTSCEILAFGGLPDLDDMLLEGRGLPVTDGFDRPEMPRFPRLSKGFARHPVVSALGGDAGGAVLGAGAPAFGHHRGALGAVVGGWVGFGRREEAADGSTQTPEQQRAARGGDIGVPGRRGQDQRPVGQLPFGPAQKRFDQMML